MEYTFVPPPQRCTTVSILLTEQEMRDIRSALLFYSPGGPQRLRVEELYAKFKIISDLWPDE